MTDTDTAIGNVALYHRFQFRKIGDAVVYKEHLPVTAHFEVYGIGNNLIAKSMHFRLNRITVGRRRLDNAQIARAHQGELQGSGDGSGGQGQGIHVYFQLAEFLLDGNAKLLFLVDNQQAEVFELNILTQDAVRTDKDIHLPPPQDL